MSRVMVRKRGRLGLKVRLFVTDLDEFCCLRYTIIVGFIGGWHFVDII